MAKNEVDMLKGSISKGLLSVAIPIMIMNVMQSLFTVIDMTVLGNLVDDNAVGAVGVCGTLITLITGLLVGVATGANVVVAKYIGKGDSEAVERTIGVSILFAFVGGVFLLIIGVSFAEIFLKLINCSENILPQAVAYFRIYFFGAPFLLLYNFFAAILRSMGDTKRPMYFLLIGGGIKVLLNFVLIKVFHLTVEGVGIATIVSNFIAGGLCFLVLIKNKGIVKFKFSRLKFYFKELKEVLYIGIPSGLQSAMYSLANVVISSTVNKLGDAATKGNSISTQFDNLMYYICHAPSLAVMAFVSQNLAQKNIVRVKRTIKTAILITLALGATSGALFAIFSGQLASMMSSDPEVIMYAQQKTIIVSGTYFIMGINEILGAGMRGMGKPIIPTIMTLIFMCLIRFPWVWFIYPLVPNLTFLYLIWPIGWTLSIISLLIAYIPTFKKIKQDILIQ